MERLYIRGALQAKLTAMSLLAQLFRHKNASPGGDAAARRTDAPGDGGDVRGIGAIAAAAGVRTEHGMPPEFTLSIGELVTRVPERCVWPGGHDARRVLRIPSSEIAPGLARGKAEMSMSRLAALAPDVFRWERGDTEPPQVRLPIQKLLQQIRSEDAASPSPPVSLSSPAQDVTHRTPLTQGAAAAENFGCDTGLVAGDLPSIHRATPEAPHSLAVGEPPDPGAANEHTPAGPTAAPEPEMPAAAGIPLPAASEPKPAFSFPTSETRDRPVELRPSKDASISTTLRAVVLGGIAPAAQTDAVESRVHILAPRIVPAASESSPAVILGPSVVPSANEGGIPLTPRTVPDFAGLQILFMTGATLDLAGVAALAATLPGVRACVISGSSGSATAGDFSRGISAEEVRAASADLARIGGAATETLHRGESDIALFLHDEACVAVILEPGGFVPGVRERLARVAELLDGAKPAR